MMGLILAGWGQMSRVLLSIAPMLAKYGHAIYEGKSYHLCGDFGDSPEARFNGVLSAIPFNIVNWFQQDLFSKKKDMKTNSFMPDMDILIT
jgi:hypothetical protein